MPVQIKCRVFFLSLYLLMMQMIATGNSFFFQMLYHIGMITDPALPVPKGIAVKITREDSLLIFYLLP